MLEPQSDLASRLLELVPMIMRAAAAELRRKEPVAALAHFGVLVTLAHGPCILSDLADQHIVSRPTMSKTVSTLVERGWVQRTPDAADRRKLWVSLTPIGGQMLAILQQESLVRVNELLALLTPGERETLSAGLVVLQRLFNIVTHQEA